MASQKPSFRESLSKEYENVNSRRSSRSGIGGFIETSLRRFRTGAFIAALTPLYLIAILVMSLSATPGIYLIAYTFHHTQHWLPVLHYLALSTSLVSAYFLYGISVIFLAPLANKLLPFRIKPFRGNYFSLYSVPWYFHNALTYLVRYTFLEFVTPTPINTLFYRMMGMKIGKNVQINTTNISDPALIEIGDFVTIGGSAHLIAHYGQKGYLVLSRVKIGNRVNIGIKSTIMGDVEIGDGAMIAPHEVVFPKSRIPANRRPPKSKPVFAEENISQRSLV